MTPFGISPYEFIEILVYCFITVFASKAIVRRLAIIYSSYSIYHYCDEDEFNEHCSSMQDKKESVVDKIKMVAGSNSLMSLFTIILIISFHYLTKQINSISSVIPVSVSVDMIISLAIMATIFNTSLRISAFGVSIRENEDLSKEQQERVRDKIISFGFSFWVTLYFLIIIGLGIAIITGNPSLQLPSFEDKLIHIVGMFTTALIIVPLTGAIVSEISLLYFFSIPDECKKCKRI
jgi:hypothetical protein